VNHPSGVATALLATACVTACSGSLPPLRGQMAVGRDGYAVVTAGGGSGGGDLYAVRAQGGPVVPITFSTVGELRPRLSPDGVRLGFLRGRSPADSSPASVWIMNLETGGERAVTLPKAAGAPEQVGWGEGGRELVISAGGRLYRADGLDGGPATPVEPAARAAAESSLAVLLGEPVFARVVPCARAADLCVAGDSGAPGPLAAGAHDAARWGPDSVAFLTGDAMEVRPLGPGRARRIDWSGLPGPARQLTAFAGRADPPAAPDSQP
jgi:hypothetical protein